jgi:hypothetical protein
MPVALATAEADIRRIVLGLRPARANSSRDPIQKIPNTKKG